MWVFLLLCALLWIPTPARGSDDAFGSSQGGILGEPSPSVPVPPPPESERLEVLVNRLLPLVEQAAGRPFLSRPEVVATHPAELSRVFYREQMYMLGRLSDLGPDEAHEAAQATAGAISSAFVGKYGFLDKRLYVISEGVSLTVAELGLPEELVQQVLEVVLAHELAHALQDQHADLGSVVGSRPDADAIMAANCVVEGHAVWVHEQVGRQLGHDRAVGVVAAIQGYDPERAEAPLDPRRLYTSYVYGRGRAFVDWHARDGGHERLWALLTRPPASSAMILRPSSYAPEARAPVSKAVRRSVRRLVRQLGDPAWPLREERVGDFELREQLADRIGNVTLADHVEASWQGRATTRDPMEGVEVRALRFRSRDAAQAYVRHMARHAVDFDAVKTDAAARESFVIEVEGRKQQLATLWLARKTTVVQIVTVNRDAPDDRQARALRRLFAALD